MNGGGGRYEWPERMMLCLLCLENMSQQGFCWFGALGIFSQISFFVKKHARALRVFRFFDKSLGIHCLRNLSQKGFLKK